MKSISSAHGLPGHAQGTAGIALLDGPFYFGKSLAPLLFISFMIP